MNIRKQLILLLLMLPAFFVHAGAFKSTLQQSEVPSYITIELRKFTPEQLARIETFYMNFSGYQQHQITQQNSSVLALKYYSDAQFNTLLNNLRKTCEHLGYEVLFRSADEHIDIQFIKLTPKSIPYKQW